MFNSIYIAAFLMDFINSSVSIALSLFLADIKGSSSLVIGLAGFAAGFSYTATTFLKARFFSGIKTSWFVYTPAIAGIIYLSLYFIPVSLILMFLLFAGFFFGIFWPSIQYCFSGEGGQKRIGIFNLCWSGGIICGSFMAGHLYAFSPLAPFTTALVLGAIATAALSVKKRGIIHLNSILRQNGPSTNASSRDIFEIRLLSFFHFTAVGAIMFLFPKLGLERSFSPQLIGIMFGILLLFRFLTFILTRKQGMLIGRYTLISSCMLFSLGCSLTGLSPYPSVILSGMIIIGVTGAFSYHNSLLLHIKYNLPTEIHEGIIGAGLFLGPLLAGFFGYILDIQTAFLIIGIMIFASGLVYSIIKHSISKT